MNRTKKRLSVKLFHIISGIFLLVSIVVFVFLGFWTGYQDLQETYTLAEETADFLKTECGKFDNYDRGNSARSLQSLLDTAIGLETFISSSQIEDSDFLSMFIRTEHVGGVIVLDHDFSLLAQADMDDKDSFSVWKETLNKSTIKDIADNPGKRYVDQITVQDIPYDFVAISSDDGKYLIVCYSSRQKPSTDPYELSIHSILANNNFYKNPTVVITDGTKLLSTNDENVDEIGAEKYLKNDTIKWKEDQLTKFEHDSKTWYGLRHVYGNYFVYVVYPDEEVFSNRTNFIAGGFMIYLVLCLIILSVQRYFDKSNMRKMEKQLRIINAISTSYESTFLMHGDRNELEPLNPSKRLGEIFDRDPVPENFFREVCRTEIAPECQSELQEFMDINTVTAKLKGSPYLGKEIRDVHGTWYSVVLIPQRYDDNGNVQAFLVVTRDVTAMKQAEELSFKDQLTGLYNRNYMEAISKEKIETQEYPVSLIMADCNYLKRTNDTLGHEYGDLLLKRIAGIMREAVPENSIVMRVGGDEFLILCRNFTGKDAEELITRIRQMLKERSDEKLLLSVSFGVCTMEDKNISFEQAYEMADQEMYRDKQRSRITRG